MCMKMMRWRGWGGLKRLWQLPSSLLFFFFPKASVVGASYKGRYTSNSHANGGGDLEKKGGWAGGGRERGNVAIESHRRDGGVLGEDRRGRW